MKQEQIQKEKTYTFEEIYPDYSLLGNDLGRYMNVKYQTFESEEIMRASYE